MLKTVQCSVAHSYTGAHVALPRTQHVFGGRNKSRIMVFAFVVQRLRPTIGVLQYYKEGDYLYNSRRTW